MDVDNGNTKPACVNLEEQFGKRYRIGWGADGATKSQTPREEWPWLMELQCRYGRIYPGGGEILQAYSDRPRIGAKLRALSCATSARGDMETVITFHIDSIKQVLAVLKPFRRRQVSGAERARLQNMGIRNRFKKDKIAA